MLEQFFEVGPADGDRPVSFSEIFAYGDRIGTTQFEASTIRVMSRKYLDGLQAGRNKSALPPYEWRTTAEAKKELNDKLNRMFK